MIRFFEVLTEPRIRRFDAVACEPLSDKDEGRGSLRIGPRVEMQHRMDQVLYGVQYCWLSAARDRQQAFYA